MTRAEKMPDAMMAGDAVWVRVLGGVGHQPRSGECLCQDCTWRAGRVAWVHDRCVTVQLDEGGAHMTVAMHDVRERHRKRRA